MGAEKLMRSLDRLDHRERMAALAERVRELSETDARALQRELAGGDVYWRWLALHAAQLRGELQLGLELLSDPSVTVRLRAAKLVGRLAPSIGGELLDGLDDATLAALLGQIVRARRHQVAEQVADALCERGRLAAVARLVPACSAAWFAARLDLPWPATVWLRVAKHHPDLLCDQLARRFDATPRAHQVLMSHGPAVWDGLARARPAAVADWIDRHVRLDGLPGVLLPAVVRLARMLPERVVGWLSEHPMWLGQVGIPSSLVRRARDVEDAKLLPLARRLAESNPDALAALLSRMPYPKRARLFEGATVALDTARREWPLSLLSALPCELADREAARMLALTRAAVDGAWRRALLGHRAIEHARAPLESESRSAQAEERAQALAALVRASARAREGLAETLVHLRRIANDQDPVRLAVIGALAQVPGHRFEDPEALDAVIAPIFDARDTSWATRGNAATVAHRLLVAWAHAPDSAMFGLGLRILERLAGHQGTPDLPRLDRNLRRGAEHAIVAVLLPWIRAAGSRHEAQHAFAVWRALGKRAWNVPALSSLLAELIWHGPKAQAPWAASLWLQDPATRDDRVCELVRKDPSASYLGPVFAHCHARRQTFLHDRFTGKAPRGRFHDGKVVHVPAVQRGFVRWPSTLQREYAALIRRAEAEPRQFSTSRAAMISLRARVPVTTVAELEPALRSSDVFVQETALAAIAITDAPEPSLPILLEHLDGDRARVAMYTMPHLARVLPRARMVDEIERVLDRREIKITVHKEALRLLGGLGTPRAVELLEQAWQRPLHRDVRIAALHAARAILGSVRAWAILAAAATDESVDVARGLVEVPLFNVAEPYRERYLQLMLRVADHPAAAARAALFSSLSSGWLWVDPVAATEVAAAVFGRLDLDDPAASAARVVASGAATRATHSTITQLTETLLDAADRDVAPAGERDRLAHRRCIDLIDALAEERDPSAQPLVHAVSTLLMTRPGWWSDGARLSLVTTGNPELASRILELIDTSPSASSLRPLEPALREIGGMSVRAWTRDTAAELVDRLVDGSPAARLLAVAALEPFGNRWGWGVPWQHRLQRLREDDDLDVRTAARRLWISNR